MRSSSGRINIAASAQKLDVDNRIALRYYYRIADNILKQADIFREEKNIIDLYVMLLRFSSLVSETIPCHRDYKSCLPINRNAVKKKLLNTLNELEKLKPAVEQKIDELNRKNTHQVNGRSHLSQNGSFASSLEWPPSRQQTANSYGVAKTPQTAARDFVHQGYRNQQLSHAKPVEEKFQRLVLSMPRPKEDTLSRHSILGPNGLRGQWQPPRSDKGVQYPSNLDFSPVEIPSLQLLRENEDVIKKESSNSEIERPSLASVLLENNDNQTPHTKEPLSLISFEPIETPIQTDLVRQPSPPPVMAEIQNLILPSPPIPEAGNGMENPLPDTPVCSESPMELHFSTTMMDTFMKLAKSNTDKHLETCGVLAGSLKNRKFYITALIIPKQESTSDMCQTTNEEEIFEVQDKQSLFPLGWIHTHPTQSCFMSSIDIHTHYSYQIMLPESIAIVMAPKDSSKKHGIFRLTTPGGMGVIRNCPKRGFHSHDPPPDGGPLYKQCTDVYMNPNINFDVIDLR